VSQLGNRTFSGDFETKLCDFPTLRCRFRLNKVNSSACWRNCFHFRRTIEIGVFTGYSCLNLALALPPDGRIVACDINKEWTDIAQRYWSEAGVQAKIEPKLGPAVETLQELAGKEAGNFDFVFVDGDKENYDGYYELSLVLLRWDGLMALDNMLRAGRIVDRGDQTPDVQVLRALVELAEVQPSGRRSPCQEPLRIPWRQ
jgi:predicted O-methyltransferase YrrM